jgi:hypothetical protein
MSFNPNDPADYIGGIDYSQLGQAERFETVTFKTKEISPDGSRQFSISESEDFIESLNITPGDSKLPIRAKIISVKVNLKGSSSDTTLKIYQSEQYNPINSVIEIAGIAVADSPETYTISEGAGTPYINKEEENEMYVELSENSNAPCKFDIEISWVSIHT